MATLHVGNPQQVAIVVLLGRAIREPTLCQVEVGVLVGELQEQQLFCVRGGLGAATWSQRC